MRKVRIKKTPASIVLPMRPVMDENTDLSGDQKKLKKFVRYTSQETTLGETKQEREKVSEYYRQRFESRHFDAVRALLKINLMFRWEPWVRKILEDPIKIRLLTQPRGRPWGSGKIDRLLIVAWADALANKQIISREKALVILSENPNIGLSFERIKALYYETLSNPRMKALLFEDRSRTEYLDGVIPDNHK